MTRPATLERAARHRRRDDRRLLVLFALVTWLVGGAVAILAGYLLFSVVAVVLGLAQAFVLAPRLTRGWIWAYTFATLLAGTASLMIFVVWPVFRFEHLPGQALATSALSGAVLGFGQAFGLRPVRHRFVVWTAGGVLGGLGAWAAFHALLDVWRPLGFLFGSSAGLALGQTLALAVLLALDRVSGAPSEDAAPVPAVPTGSP